MPLKTSITIELKIDWMSRAFEVLILQLHLISIVWHSAIVVAPAIQSIVVISIRVVSCMRVCVCIVYVCCLNAWMRAHVNLLFVSCFDVQTNTRSVAVLHRLLLAGWLHLHHNKQLLLFTSPSSHCRIPNEFNVKPSWFGILILVSQLSQFIPFFGFVHSFCLRIYIMRSCFGLQ